MTSEQSVSMSRIAQNLYTDFLSIAVPMPFWLDVGLARDATGQYAFHVTGPNDPLLEMFEQNNWLSTEEADIRRLITLALVHTNHRSEPRLNWEVQVMPDGLHVITSSGIEVAANLSEAEAEFVMAQAHTAFPHLSELPFP